MNRKHLLILIACCLSFFGFTSVAQAQNADSLQINMPVRATDKSDSSFIFEAVEIEASVNVQLWRHQLESHLQKPIEKAAKKGMKAGQYTVNVRFLVEKDGSISDVRTLNDPGYGLAEASEKVVRTGPRWNAGVYKGKKVRSYHTQPITFVISEK
jgi:protein TonB